MERDPVNARKTEWTKHDVRAFLTEQKGNGNEVTMAAAESFLRRYGVVIGQRDAVNSKNATNKVNLYDPVQIREEFKNLPGQGAPGKSRPSRKKSA